MKCGRVPAGAFGALGAVSVLTALLMAVILLMALTPSVMLRQMRECAPPDNTGLPEAEYPGMADMITGYLAGRTDTFQYVFEGADGVRYQCFRENERKHMADCRALTDSARRVLWLSLSCAVLFFAAGLILQRVTNRNAAHAYAVFWRGFSAGAAVVLVCFAAIAVWAATDFESLFTAFHRAAFRNELWLLEPRTSLLIRLMPTRFFTRYGLIGGGIFAGVSALLAAAAIMIRRRIEGKKHGI